MGTTDFDICIVVAGQPSTNPRTVKEAETLAKNGYSVCVVYTFSVSWADVADESILSTHPRIVWKRVGGHPLCERLTFQVSRICYKAFTMSSRIIAWHSKFAINRGSWALIKGAKGIRAKLYIGHNLAALPAVAEAAKVNSAQYIFDAEDYYRGQGAEDSREAQQAIFIEDMYLPGSTFVTAASPMIADKYKLHYPDLNLMVVNNAFSIENVNPCILRYERGETLRLFWFSQTVSKGRGIEDVLAAMLRLNNPNIEFTILGNCTNAEKERLLQVAGTCSRQINFCPPVEQKEIFNIASTHHIGLALEGDGTLNRDICLTNKIFTYLLTGLAIVATNTPSQKLFLDTYPGVGRYFSRGDINALAKLMNYLILNPQEVNNMRNAALELAQNTFNWEREQQPFLKNIKALPGFN